MANTIKFKRGSGSDPGSSDLSVGEIAIRTDTAKIFTKNDGGSVVEISGGVEDGDITTSKIADDAVTFAKIQNVSATNRILGRDSSGAGVIEEITPANLRTMINVADGATNVTNTNQLTNGAGFITATLTNEQVQDIVGGMVTGNTETGITVTYQDGDGTLDFVVGTLNQDTTGNAATATALETARNIGGVSFDGTGNINLPGVNTSGNQNTSGNAATATKLATARTIAGVSFDGSANISLNNNAITNGAGYLTSVSTSDIADNAVDLNKLSDLDNGRILARVSSGSGNPEAATAAQIRTLLNVADGATAGGGATGGGSDEVFYENDQTVTTNYTITNGKNAMAAGPITINSGVTVTVGSGETLTIV